jgi:DNA-binding beta-propeller fold protein YncE
MSRLHAFLLRRRLPVALGIVGLALAAFPAMAAADHPFLPSYFSFPKEKKGFPIPSPLLPEHGLSGYETPAETFKDACGLAVDNQGVVYVSDYYHDVVDQFGWTKEEEAPGKTVERFRYFGTVADADPNGSPCGLAVHAGRLYVNDYRRGVWLYEGGGATEIDAGPATGVAVDSTTGRVYVTHLTYVAVYEADGTPVLEGLEPLRIGVGNLEDAYGAAVSTFAATKGRLYVADAGTETVKVFDPATSTLNPIETIDGSLGPQQGFRDLIDTSLAIDPSDGNLLVSDRLAEAEEPPMVVDELTPDGHFRGQLQHLIGDGEPPGIAVDPTNGTVYVTTGRGVNSGVYAFGPAGQTRPLLLTKGGSGEGTVTSAPTGITCPASCAAGEAEFDLGVAASLQADPAPHSTFVGWSVAGHPSACSGTGPCQVQMTEGAEVTAEFAAIPQQTLTVAIGGNAEGAVVSEPAGIECGDFCSEHFDEGSSVVLNADPAARSHLAGWTVEGQPSACTGTGSCEVTMDQATKVTATFAQNPDRDLALSISGPGRIVSSPSGIDCQSSCEHAFPDGTGVTLEAQPADGYELLSWTGACSGKVRCVVSLEADRSVSATFVRIEDAFAVSVIGSGTGNVSDPSSGIDCGLTCAGIFKRGSVLKLTAQAEKGSRFIGFSGCDQVAGATCTVTVSDAKTVTALFGEAPEIAVRRVVVHGATATLAVSVPAPGVLQARGRGIVNAKLRARSEGVVTLRLSLSKKGRSMLRRSKEGKLSIHVGVTFTSADGSKTDARKIVTFKKRPGR